MLTSHDQSGSTSLDEPLLPFSGFEALRELAHAEAVHSHQLLPIIVPEHPLHRQRLEERPVRLLQAPRPADAVVALVR